MEADATPLDTVRAPSDDPAEFTRWVEPHWATMALIARRLAPAGLADDVTQDALVLAWRKRAQFDPARGSARTWLLTLVADSARKSRRSLLRRPATTLLDDDRAADPATGRDLDVENALGRLSSRQRLAVGLHYYLGLTTAEAAVVMRCAEGTVKATLSDARARLRTVLGEDFR